MDDAYIKNDIHLHAVATAFVDFNDYYYFMWCDVCFGWMVDLMVQSNQFSIWRGGGGSKFNSLCLTRHVSMDAPKMDFGFD